MEILDITHVVKYDKSVLFVWVCAAILFQESVQNSNYLSAPPNQSVNIFTIRVWRGDPGFLVNRWLAFLLILCGVGYVQVFMQTSNFLTKTKLMKTFVKDQADIQEGTQVQSINSVEADRPKVANISIKAKRESGSNDDFSCEIEVQLSDVSGVEGNSLSVNITCGENSAFDTTIEGSGSEPSPVDQGVMTSSPLNVEIPSGIEEYSFTAILSEDGEEIETENFTVSIYFDLSE